MHNNYVIIVYSDTLVQFIIIVLEREKTLVNCLSFCGARGWVNKFTKLASRRQYNIYQARSITWFKSPPLWEIKNNNQQRFRALSRRGVWYKKIAISLINLRPYLHVCSCNTYNTAVIYSEPRCDKYGNIVAKSSRYVHYILISCTIAVGSKKIISYVLD